MTDNDERSTIITGVDATAAGLARSGPHDQPASLFRRIVANPATLLVLGIGLMIAAALLSALLGQAIPQGRFDPVSVLVALIVAAIFVAMYAVLVRGVERAPLTDFGSRGAVRELAGGIALGALLFATVVGIAALLGVYSVTGDNPWQTIWPMLAIAISSGVTEEIMLRGVVFRYLERLTGSWIALAFSAALFGALHLANPNASPLAAFAIAIEAGVLLGAVYMLTRRLWAAIGLHAAWNFTQGWVFGLPISGTSEPGIVRGQLTGSDILTGGGFGLEASIIAMVVATAAGIFVLTRAIRRGRLVAPAWRRGTTAAPVFP